MKKVTVIMPCYNCAGLLGEALKSLEDQTEKDFKLICVDDGSTDDTAALLEQWQKKGTLDMTVIRQENSGVSCARNRALKDADTEFIAFLDADDIYHPRYLELLLGPAVKGADVVYCRLSRDMDNVRGFAAEVQPVRQEEKQAMEKLLYQMGSYGFYCYLYRRELLDGLKFDEMTKFGEDREFNWKYLCRCKKIYWVDAPLYGYRVNTASATQTNASWRKTDLLMAVKRIQAYMEINAYPYREEFRDYMYARAMWAVAKTFASAKDKGLFRKLMEEYDVKKCMKRTAKDSSKLVALASKMYLVNPWLYYYAIGMKK